VGKKKRLLNLISQEGEKEGSVFRAWKTAEGTGYASGPANCLGRQTKAYAGERPAFLQIKNRQKNVGGQFLLHQTQVLGLDLKVLTEKEEKPLSQGRRKTTRAGGRGSLLPMTMRGGHTRVTRESRK